MRKAVAAYPDNTTAHLYLALSLNLQYIPGATSPENARLAEEAIAEFQTVLTLDPANAMATKELASIYYNQHKFDEAEEWNKKTIALDPTNKEAYYTLGVIAWSGWLPVDRQARADSNMQPDDPGPIRNASVREQLKPKWMPVLDEGISNFVPKLR